MSEIESWEGFGFGLEVRFGCLNALPLYGFRNSILFFSYYYAKFVGGRSRVEIAICWKRRANPIRRFGR